MRRRILYHKASDVPTISYSVPVILLSYSTASYNDTYLDPVFSYSQIETITYSDHTETNTITSGASVTFTISNAISGVSINATSGRLTFEENTSSDQKTLCTVSVEVVLNGLTGTLTCDVYQKGIEESEWLPAIVDAVQINNIPVSGTDGIAIGVAWYQDKIDGTISDRIFGDTDWPSLGETILCQYEELNNSGMTIERTDNRTWKIKCPANMYYEETVIGRVSMRVDVNDVTGEWSGWYDVFQYSSTLEDSFDANYLFTNTSGSIQEYPDPEVISQYSIPIQIKNDYRLWVRVSSGGASLSDEETSGSSNISLVDYQLKLVDTDDTFSESLQDIKTWELKTEGGGSDYKDLSTDWMQLSYEDISVWLQFVRRYAELQSYAETNASAVIEWKILQYGFTPNN